MNLQQDTLLDAMLKPGFYPDPVDHVELIETHISQVFLTGRYAYKIKKPVNFGFLDFSDLDKRKFYCEEEVRLNGRLAPDIYLGVIAITRSQKHLEFNGNGQVIEYAIKMKQFPGDGLLSKLAEENKLTINHINNLARVIARFHQSVSILDSQPGPGDADEILNPVIHNFEILKPIINSPLLKKLNHIEQACLTLHRKLTPVFTDRKNSGFIRECHGDLHLGNITLINNKTVPFDGIEFNDSFRWIDTMSDIAFLVMDLEDHNQQKFAVEFLNTYLEITGDYPGLKVLVYYKIYRAMVRAKVTGLRLQQIPVDSEEYRKDISCLTDYLNLAEKYCHTKKASIIITHGISGSGKSWIAQYLKNRIDAIVIHSDHERKRLFSESDNKLYSQQTTDQVYNHLLYCTQNIIDSGYNALVDATFLDSRHRKAFRKAAKNSNVKFYILNCIAGKEILESRIIKRNQEEDSMSDADVDIMKNQIDHYRPLEEDELENCITIDTGSDIDFDSIINSLTS